MIIKQPINGKEKYFYVHKRKRQKRIIIRPKDISSYTVTAPKYTTKHAIISVIKANQHTLTAMKPMFDIKSHFKPQQHITIFGRLYMIQAVLGKKQTIIDANTITISNKTNSQASIEKQLYHYLKETLHQEITQLAIQYNHKVPHIDLPTIRPNIRYMTSKFGSCQPLSKKLSFNLELVHYPKQYLEYIYTHEIAHFIHPNHSQAFYQTLTTLYINHKVTKKQLNTLRRTLYEKGFSTLYTACAQKEDSQ